MSHKKYRKETNCLNCGTDVPGKFCPECGQENIETRENFFHLAGHFISDYFHFDSKFFRSLIPLFTKPGFLTKEYWEGRRVKYIHPLRIFFFVTILFMIATGYFYHHFGDRLKESMIHSSGMAVEIDSAYLASLPDTIKLPVSAEGDSSTVAEIRKERAGNDRRVGKMQSGLDFVFKNFKYVMFFLLPVYALIFRLLYFRRKKYYVDHLVFAMHLQTFVYFLLGIIMVLPFIFSMTMDVMRQIAFVFILIYVGFSLHYLYRQPWWKTILKSLIATFLLFFTTILSVVVLTVIDAMYFQ